MSAKTLNVGQAKSGDSFTVFTSQRKTSENLTIKQVNTAMCVCVQHLYCSFITKAYMQNISNCQDTLCNSVSIFGKEKEASRPVHNYIVSRLAHKCTLKMQRFLQVET